MHYSKKFFDKGIYIETSQKQDRKHKKFKNKIENINDLLMFSKGNQTIQRNIINRIFLISIENLLKLIIS